MNRMLISISFAALLAAVPALAADPNDQNHNGGGHPAPQAHEQHAPGGEHGGGPGGHMAGPNNHMAAPAGPMAAPQAHAAPPAPHPAVNNSMMHSEAGHHHGDGAAHGNEMEHMNGMAHSNAAAIPGAAVHDNAMSQHGNGQHNNGMSHMGGMGNGQHANHANFGALHRNFTAPRRFHAGHYHRPYGYYAHRWTYGQILPSAFFVRNYWIDDFYDYGLMDPPPGTVWVRYGDDALLIDQYTGEVIQVEYGIFY